MVFGFTVPIKQYNRCGGHDVKHDLIYPKRQFHGVFTRVTPYDLSHIYVILFTYTLSVYTVR